MKSHFFCIAYNGYLDHSVHAPLYFSWSVKSSTKFSKRWGMGGLPGSPYLEGVAGKERGDLFQEGLQFYKKNKLKSEMFKDKKNL